MTPLNTAQSERMKRYCQIVYEDGKDFPVLDHCKLAIIGYDKDFSNSVREEICHFHNHFPHLRIADIGNCRSTETEFILPLFKELVNSGIIPIVLGAPAHLIQKLSHRLHPDHSETIHHISNRLIAYHSDDKIEALGFQRHLCPISDIDELEEVSRASMSLAKLRAHPDIMEAVLRDAALVHLNANVIKLADNPASMESVTSGMTCAEACQAMKLVGSSNRLQLVNIVNQESTNTHDMRVGHIAIAQMIWYFLEGIHQKTNDHPTMSTQHQTFVINSMDTDIELSFYRHEQTGRWWFSPNDPTKYIACSYEEYVESSRGDIPDRLLRYVMG